MKRYCKPLLTATGSSSIPSKSQPLLCVLNDEEKEDKQAGVDLQVYDLTSSVLPHCDPEIGGIGARRGGQGVLARGTGSGKRNSKRLCLFPSVKKRREKILISRRLTGGLNARLLCRSRPAPIIFPSVSEREGIWAMQAHTHTSAHRPPRQLSGDEWRPRPIGSLSMHVQVDRIEFKHRNDRPFFFGRATLQEWVMVTKISWFMALRSVRRDL